jgi:hypothetical protein
VDGERRTGGAVRGPPPTSPQAQQQHQASLMIEIHPLRIQERLICCINWCKSGAFWRKFETF